MIIMHGLDQLGMEEFELSVVELVWHALGWTMCKPHSFLGIDHVLLFLEMIFCFLSVDIFIVNTLFRLCAGSGRFFSFF